MSDEQERLKGIILAHRETDTYTGALVNLLIVAPIDEVVNCAIIHAEMEGKTEASLDDILWASEFLDYLDTVGWKITPKNRRQRRERPHLSQVSDLPSGGDE